MNGDKISTPLSAFPEVTEVGIIVWVLLSSPDFKMAKFTLASLEAGLENPQCNTVLATIHLALLTPASELASIRKRSKGKQINEDHAMEKPIETWTLQLADVMRKWGKDRRTIARNMALMEDGEDDQYNEEYIQWYKEQIEELDSLLDPVLVKPLPAIVIDEDSSHSSSPLPVKKTKTELRRELDESETQVVNECLPFSDSETYLRLPAYRRLYILRALCLWRAYGYPESSVQDTLRLFDVESLRQTPLGEDDQHRRYYYFPQFYRDMRVYRETPSGNIDSEHTENLIKQKLEEEAAEKKRVAEELKRKKKEEEETKRLLLESGRRSSGRKRVEPQRFDQFQAQQFSKRGRYDEDSSDGEVEQKPASVLRRKNKVKLPKLRYAGPEPEPSKWELICSDIPSLEELIKDLAKQNPRVHFNLVIELEDTLATMRAEEATIQRDEERVRRKEMWEIMPRKRSSRIADVQAKQDEIDQEIELEQEREEAMRLEQEENARLQQRMLRQRERENRLEE